MSDAVGMARRMGANAGLTDPTGAAYRAALDDFEHVFRDPGSGEIPGWAWREWAEGGVASARSAGMPWVRILAKVPAR